MQQSSILVVAHNRPENTGKLLQSLAQNPDFNEFCLIVTMDGRNEDVIQEIEQIRTPDYLINFEPAQNESIASRISRNVRLGLEFSFKVVGSQWAIVLEDDLVVTDDILRWHKIIQEKYSSRKSFVAANSFSAEKPITPPHANWATGHVKLNYGVGWGWSISGKSYARIAWAFPFSTGQIWDAQIEPAVRAGFVVNPLASRVINNGFGPNASHTRELGVGPIEKGLKDSFSHATWSNDISSELVEPFNWREDCINLSVLSPTKGFLVLMIGRLRSALERTSRISPEGIKDLLKKIGKRLLKVQVLIGGKVGK